MRFRVASVLLLAPLAVLALDAPAKPAGLRFVVTIDPKQVGAKPQSGRVVVGIAKKDEHPDFTNYKPPVLPFSVRTPKPSPPTRP